VNLCPFHGFTHINVVRSFANLQIVCPLLPNIFYNRTGQKMSQNQQKDCSHNNPPLGKSTNYGGHENDGNELYGLKRENIELKVF
jgi:nitrite reductase/ring-hydroxylating ferredoxin subunit